jgi:hypothetical protein
VVPCVTPGRAHSDFKRPSPSPVRSTPASYSPPFFHAAPAKEVTRVCVQLATCAWRGSSSNQQRGCALANRVSTPRLPTPGAMDLAEEELHGLYQWVRLRAARDTVVRSQCAPRCARAACNAAAAASQVDDIPLSRPKKNIARDFSDGGEQSAGRSTCLAPLPLTRLRRAAVLVAEIVAHFFPRIIELHNYRCAPCAGRAQWRRRTLAFSRAPLIALLHSAAARTAARRKCTTGTR